MLNISNNPVDRDEILEHRSAYQEVMGRHATKKLVYLLSTVFALGLIMLFLPWTQNIRARGTLTTLDPQDREQHIHSMISGRIEKWYVREGQEVKKGDTIVFISEMKAEYLDPQLVERAGNQTRAKASSMQSYQDKAKALDDQISALNQNRKLKIEQAKNYLQQAVLKVQSDSIEYETAMVALEIAEKQFARQQTLYDQGLKSLTELEQRRQKLQDSQNKVVAAENKWLTSQNNYINAQLNLSTVQSEYREKIAKAQSDRQSALSSAYQAEADFNKLSIQQSNYDRRMGFYYILAPQDGYVTQAMVTGIGETVKEGQEMFSFIPKHIELAVELYVRPIDLPLIRHDNHVRMQFDGWPALVFTGWPDLSFGTYSGVVVTYDKVISKNGMFRVLVAQDPESEPWPELLRQGSGVYGLALLHNVPVWYELWRNLNGFPPDFYKEKKEAPQKQVRYE